MILHLETDAIRDKKDNRPLLHQKPRHRLTGGYPQKVQAAEERALLEQEERFRADISSGRKCTSPRHVIYGTRPCVSITSLNPDAQDGDKCRFRHVEADGQPSKKPKKMWCERMRLLY